MNVKTGSFAQPGSTGNQSVSGLGFTPTVVIFFGNYLTDDGSSVNANMFFGAATSSSARATMSCASLDAAATSACDKRWSNALCITQITAGTPTVTAEADFVSLDSGDDGGFTINWTTVDATARIINYIALDNQAKVGSFTAPVAAGDKAITGVGFKPDAIIIFDSTVTTTHTSAGNAGSSAYNIGWATAIAQANRASMRQDAKATSNTWGYQRTNSVQNSLSGAGAVVRTATLKSFDDDGFTLTFSVAPANAVYISYIAFKGGKYYVGSFNQNTTAQGTGNQSVSGIGLTPVGVLFQSDNVATSSSVQSTSKISFGVGVSSTQRASIWSDDLDNQADSVADSNLDRTKCLKCMTAGTPTVNTEMDFVSCDSDGFTINNTTVDATSREILYFAFGGGDVSTTTDIVQLESSIINPIVTIEEIGNVTVVATPPAIVSSIINPAVTTINLINYRYRIKLTIDHTKIDETLTDFPLQVYLGEDSGIDSTDLSDLFDKLGTDENRQKIIVATEDDVECPVEIVRWDTANKKAWLFTKIPSISTDVDTVLYLYYDPLVGDNPTYVGDINSTPAESVWSEYAAVYHLVEPSGHFLDSTVNHNHSTLERVAERGLSLPSGQIGYCTRFDGDPEIGEVDSIGIPSSDSLNLGTGDFTVTARILATGTLTDSDLCRKGSTGATPASWWKMEWGDGNTNQRQWMIQVNGSSYILQSVEVPDNEWHNQSLVRRTDNTTIEAYWDGGLVASRGANNGSVSNSSNMAIGSKDTNNDDPLDGFYDELKIRNVASSAAWLKAEFNSDEDNLISFSFLGEDIPFTGIITSTSTFSGNLYKTRVFDGITTVVSTVSGDLSSWGDVPFDGTTTSLSTLNGILSKTSLVESVPTFSTIATVWASLSWSQTNSFNYDTGAMTWAKVLSNGTGNSSIDNVWWDTTNSIPSGGTQTYDLSSVSRNIFGATLKSSFTNIKAIIIDNLCDGDNNLYVTATGNGFTYPFNGSSSGVVIPPLSPTMFVNYKEGWKVDATHKDLQLNNLGRSGLNYRIGAVGVR